MFSRIGFLLGLSSIAALLSACAASGDAGAWKCAAKDIVSGSYNGGPTAYIHLQPYSRGDAYPVTLNAEKTEARGTTLNGTPFTCTKS